MRIASGGAIVPEPIRLTVPVTRADQARDPYFYVPVDVPEGTTRLEVEMRYPHTESCIVDLGLLDPRATDYPSAEGFRGWSGGARDRFFVARDDATPGYIPGEMPAGRWRIVLGLYRLPPEGTTVELTVRLDDSPRPLVSPVVRAEPVRPGAGWYKGDLHSHTFHSDARGAPEVLEAAARQAGLDFLGVADHNTISQRRYFSPRSTPELVFVRGMEVTTANGHANVFGLDEWIDFRMTRPSDAHTLARLVHEAGGLLSINHDKPDIPWDYELPAADCMEVWQTSWFAWNWVSLDRWQARLASGLRLAAIGGSDFHQPEALRPEGPLVLARPTTVLWLPELSERAVLAAMKAGRGYVTENPAGPHLALTVNGRPMGASTEGPVEAEAETRGAAGDRLVFIDATGPVAEMAIEADQWTGRWSGRPQGFLRAEIVAEASRARLLAQFREATGAKLPWGLDEAELAAHPVRRAVSNPVYLRPTG